MSDAAGLTLASPRDAVREAVVLARSYLAAARMATTHGSSAETWILKADDSLRTALSAAGPAPDVEALQARIAVLEEALRPFSRADRAVGGESGPFRFETAHGHRLIEREDLRRAGDAMAGRDGIRRAARTLAKEAGYGS